jgi:hypothetical protein
MNIHEEKNPYYEVEEIKMSNDQEIKNTHEPLPKMYSFFMLITGKPNSGKSTLWINLLIKKSKNTFYKQFDKVYIFSNSIETITEKIHLPEEQILPGLDQLEEVLETIRKTKDKTLLVLDDCMSEVKATDHIMKMIANRRHIGGGVSIIITSQIFNRIPLSIRKMASDVILFNTSNKKELESVFSDFSSLSKPNFLSLCEHIFDHDAHNFMWLQTATETYFKNFNKIIILKDK